MNRIGRVERTTKESSVVVEIDLDGAGKVDVSTGVEERPGVKDPVRIAHFLDAVRAL